VARVRKGSTWGYIDLGGTELISLQYEYAGNYREGMAPVRLHNQWGYIDRCGTVILPFAYDQAHEFQNGQAWVLKDDKAYYIDRTGKYIKKAEEQKPNGNTPPKESN
jgi:hypothetical protein